MSLDELGTRLARPAGTDMSLMPRYRLRDTTGDDLGLLEHPAPNLEPGDVVALADGREALVTARVDAEPGWGQLVALLEVAVSPDRAA